MKAAFSSILGAAALAFVASAASAGTMTYANSGAPLSSPGSYTVDAWSSSATTGSLNFDINGYLSLDGQNYYEDDFTLSVNGSQVFAGTFNLGGGGNNVWTPTTATVTPGIADGVGPTWNGGTATVGDLSINLQSGLNTIEFAYNSPTGDALFGAGSHNGPQGLGDEGWSVSNISLTSAGVPEPAAWSLMLLGVGGIGASLRNRRRKALAV